MIFSLDYDETYSADPSLWDRILKLMTNNGDKVYIVTMRPETQPCDITPTAKRLLKGVIYTNGYAKQDFTQRLGIDIAIWIDDSPKGILVNKPSVMMARPGATSHVMNDD